MFTHQVKYRGCNQVANFYPEPHQPRPGLIEANQCVKQCLAVVKQSTVVVLSVSADSGIKCVDTSCNPARTVMKNTVYEIAHCGVDVSRPKMFTIIVGSKGEKSQFFCHIFKAESKEAAARVTVAVANACTKAFQAHKSKKKGGGSVNSPPSRSSSGGSSGGGTADEIRLKKMKDMRRESLKKTKPLKPVKITCKLTDSWFQPSAKRDIINTKLKNARVGDFYVRESSTQVGNYAISCQTGKNIWTGLVHHSDDGFQLGNTKAILFDELTDLIAYNMENTFMNDDYGYPMSLRPNKKQESKTGAAGGGVPSPGGSAQPDEAWPDDEEDDAALNAPGLSEAQQFEAFMNSKHVMGPDSSDEEIDGPDMSSMDAALGHLDSVQQEVEADDFNPRGNAPVADDPFAATPAADPFAAPAPAAAPVKTAASMAQAIFSALPKDDENCLGGNDIRPVLMGSSLEMADLGAVWMEVDQDRRGKIDLEQLAMILCMIQQKQAGQTPDLASVDPNGPAPTCAGY